MAGRYISFRSALLVAASTSKSRISLYFGENLVLDAPTPLPKAEIKMISACSRKELADIFGNFGRDVPKIKIAVAVEVPILRASFLL